MKNRLAAFIAAVTFGTTVEGADHAVVLLYHHVDDDTPASTSVTPETFERHLDYLWNGNFFVLPLEEILDALSAGEPLPDNTVAITFDDSYVSVYRTAWPLLVERHWPFTVFVSTDYIDKSFDAYMSWEQLRELEDGGGTIGNHGRSHAHPLQRLQGESRTSWIARFRDDAVVAANRIETETGVETRVYAYPYGEFNGDAEAVIADLGWYGVGQQSGAIGSATPLTSAPRFPISTGYADADAFALRVHARPLPVRVLEPRERILEPGSPAPRLLLMLEGGPYPPAAIGCFTSDGERIEVTWQDEKRFLVQAPLPLPVGRSKYTCTAPYPGKSGVFGWYSHLWITQAGD